MWNPDIVSEYIALLMSMKEYARVIHSKKHFIKHLKKEGTIDH